LRTNLGRGEVLRHEIIHAHTGRLPLAMLRGVMCRCRSTKALARFPSP
jgi:hypothetical protein